MNVFEDLIEELKEENLLEETVMGTAVHAPKPVMQRTAGGPESLRSADTSSAPGADEGQEGAEPSDELEFYRKRAMDEVSSLQMVEHVLSGVEREHMKMAPAAFDDLAVKKALHRFLQVTSSPGSEEYAEAESALLKETEAWFSALAARDENISVANIRRFCENSRPVLSSQALMALARFYRNSPFSEPVRGKFDFVMTRLFSRETGEDQRKQLFGRADMVGHIKTLYSNWASLDLFSDDNAENITAAVEGFDKLASEAAAAERFDHLITGEIFNRIRIFKEETSELFFASEVTAAAVECNVKVGNRFVELLRAEGDLNGLETIEERYGYTYDTVISSAASKTLHLLEILKEERIGRVEREARVEAEPEQQVTHKVPNFERAPVNEASRIRFFAINKWLVAASIVVLLLTAGVYFWSENAAAGQGEIANATTVEISDPDLRQHLRLARMSSETLYGLAQPTWDARSAEEQRALLRKAFAMAQSLKMKRVNILNNSGRTIGYATAETTELLGSQN